MTTDELSREAREIIERARGVDEPTVADKARVRAGVNSAIAAPGSAMVIKLLLGLVVVGGVGAGVYFATRGSSESTTATSPSPSPSPSTTTSTSTSASASTSTSTSTVPEAPSTPAPLHPSTPTPVKIKPTVAPVDPVESLKEEKALIEQATRRLDGGDPGGALKILGLHQKKFRNGQLTAERVGTRVLALCDLGKAEQARTEAGRFLGRWSGHPMAERVRAACAP